MIHGAILQETLLEKQTLMLKHALFLIFLVIKIFLFWERSIHLWEAAPPCFLATYLLLESEAASITEFCLDSIKTF